MRRRIERTKSEREEDILEDPLKTLTLRLTKLNPKWFTVQQK
jgi:hypothetical protein